MIRVTIILFLMIAVTLSTQGQATGSFGLKAGFSLANQSYEFTPIDYSIETQEITGPALAIFMEAFKGDHFSFQLDLAYAVKGSKTTTESVTVNHLENNRIIVNSGELATSKFSYLCFSPMARYRFEMEHMVPYFLLGPRLDILLNYETDSKYPLEDQSNVILGLTAGAGLEFRLKSLNLLLEIQFQPDLSPVTTSDPLLVNNNMLSLTLGFRKNFSFGSE